MDRGTFTIHVSSSGSSPSRRTRINHKLKNCRARAMPAALNTQVVEVHRYSTFSSRMRSFVWLNWIGKSSPYCHM